MKRPIPEPKKDNFFVKRPATTILIAAAIVLAAVFALAGCEHDNRHTTIVNSKDVDTIIVTQIDSTVVIDTLRVCHRGHEHTKHCGG